MLGGQYYELSNCLYEIGRAIDQIPNGSSQRGYAVNELRAEFKSREGHIQMGKSEREWQISITDLEPLSESLSAN